ncbi:MAG: CHAD domain-containing protein [Gemmataceae bacterium]
MSDGKWITGLGPGTPADAAARTVLAVRLPAVVPHLAPAAAGHPDPEHVHQLRVAARRANAAVAVFRGLLPEKAARRAKKVLRSVRRAAGDARDWDVFLLALNAAKRTARSHPGLDYLAGYAAGRRAAAQADLAALPSERAAALGELVETLPAQARPDPDHPGDTFGALARRVLGELFDDFTGRLAVAGSDPSALHQLRIAGKKLRYAMEVFSDCFHPAFRGELYPAVEDLQEALGRVQDGHVAAERLAAILARLPDLVPDRAAAIGFGVNVLLLGHERQSRDGEQAFQAWKQRWAGLMAAHPLATLVAIQRPGETDGGTGSDRPDGGGSGSSRSRGGSGARTRSRGASGPTRLGRT